jgi:hypothetical protein
VICVKLDTEQAKRDPQVIPNSKNDSDLGKRVMRDTGKVMAGWATVAVSLILVLALPDPLESATAREGAKVIWARADRAYVAIADTAVVEEGDLVTFADHRETLGSGVVAEVLHGELAVVTLASGSLERVRKLDRVRVRVSHPPLPTTLRIGFPSRASLLFTCDQAAFDSATVPPVYDARKRDVRTWQLIRSTGSAFPSWPETLLARFFDEAPDEEIALERGELDAAIFWPGELSARHEQDPRWRGSLTGTRSRGAVTLSGSREAAEAAAEDSATWDAFNAALFRGDLERRNLAAAGTSASASAPGPLPVIEVDGALPGRAALQSWLDRSRPRGVSGGAPGVRLAFRDMPPDSVGSAGPAREAPLFAVRCRVVSAPRLRRALRAMGTDHLVDMIPCARPTR